MSIPELRRFGDSFVFTWSEEAIGIGLEGLHRERDGVVAEVTVESTAPGFEGHVHGPVRLNLLSTTSQNQLAKILAERVNHVDWHAMLVAACNQAVTRWRHLPPALDLATHIDPGPVKLLLPSIPDGETTVIYGDGEGGKSLLMLLIGVAALTGVVLPWAASVKEPLHVMLLDWETNARTVASRLHRIVRGYGLEQVPSLMYREMQHPLAECIEELRADRDKHQIDLFLFDSLSFAVNGSLNEDDVARGAMNAMRSLAPATRIATAHISAESAKATHGTASPFGSRFFWNGMRSGIEIRRAEESPDDIIDLGVFPRKANDVRHEKPYGVRVRFDGMSGPITFTRSDLDASPELASRTPIAQRLRAALRHGAATKLELAEEVGADVKVVDMTLRRMHDVMRIDGHGQGVQATWGLTQ